MARWRCDERCRVVGRSCWDLSGRTGGGEGKGMREGGRYQPGPWPEGGLLKRGREEPSWRGPGGGYPDGRLNLRGLTMVEYRIYDQVLYAVDARWSSTCLATGGALNPTCSLPGFPSSISLSLQPGVATFPSSACAGHGTGNAPRPITVLPPPPQSPLPLLENILRYAFFIVLYDVAPRTSGVGRLRSRRDLRDRDMQERSRSPFNSFAGDVTACHHPCLYQSHLPLLGRGRRGLFEPKTTSPTPLYMMGPSSQPLPTSLYPLALRSFLLPPKPWYTYPTHLASPNLGGCFSART